MASLFDAFTPQAGNAPIPPPSNYVMQSSANGYQPPASYQPTRTAPPSGGGVSAPAGAQDQYDSFLGGQASKPLINSATGQPLDKTGQVDESQVDTRSLWQRMGIGGRLGTGLETGSMLASMIPGGKTIGENIAQVSGAIHNLPLAELEHAYQMGQPGLQRAQALMGLQAQQADIGLKQAQAGYQSVRGQQAIEANRVRMERDALIRAEAGKQELGVGRVEEDTVGLNGELLKKGQAAHGYWVNTIGTDVQNEPAIIKKFQPYSSKPFMVEDRYGSSGGGLSGASAMAQYTNQYMSQNPGSTLDDAMNQWEKITKVDPVLSQLMGGAGIPQRPAAPQADRSKADEEEYKQVLLNDKPIKPADVIKMSPQTRQSYGLDPDPFNPNFMQDPGKVQDFASKHNKQISSYKAEYERLPRNQQTGFQDFLINKGYNPQTHQFTQTGTKKVATSTQISNYAKTKGISEAAAKQEFQTSGYSIQ